MDFENSNWLAVKKGDSAGCGYNRDHTGIGGFMDDQSSIQIDLFQGIEIGFGAWAWGDRLMWGYGRGYSLGDLRAVFEICAIFRGAAFSTPPKSYGQGQSEIDPRPVHQEPPNSPVEIATKFMPFPWRLSRQALVKALKGSLQRLGLDQVLLYQVHMPLPPVNVETWMEAMTEVVQAGLTRAVGVSNYDQEQMQTGIRASAARRHPPGFQPGGIQPVEPQVEKNGLLKLCQDMDVKLIAYSPLCMGVLTGKYTPG